MYLNENLVKLTKASVRYVPRGTVYHETAIDQLVKPPDITYLFQLLG